MQDCGQIGQPPCPPKTFSQVIAERGEPAAPPIPTDARLGRVAAARAVVAFKKQNPDMNEQEMSEIAGHYGQDAESVAEYLQNLRADHGNIVSKVLQGFLFRGADELVSLVPDALGGGEAGREELRLRNDLASLDNPILSTVAEIGGGIGNAVLTGGLGAARLGLSTAKTAALEGGGYGALYGAGGGETMGERVKGAAIEGTLGTLLGAGIGKTVSAMAGLGPRSAALKRELAAIEASGGFQAVKKTLADFRAAGKGDEIMPLDLSGHLRKQADFATTNNSATFVKAEEALRPRQANMTQRLADDMEELVGDPNALARAAEIKTGKREWANEAYDEMGDFDVNFDLTDLAPHLNKRGIRDLVKQARYAGDLAVGDPMDDLLTNGLQARLAAGSRDPADMALAKRLMNKEEIERPWTFDDMKQLRRALRGRATVAHKKSNGDLRIAYNDIADQVDNAIAAKIPQFKAVNRRYASMTRLEEIAAAGVKSWGKKNVRHIKEMLDTLTPRQQNEWRMSLASGLMDDLRGTSTNVDMAKRIMDKSINMDEKLRVIFGSEEVFDTFMRGAALESTMAKGLSIVGGSPTTERLANAGGVTGEAVLSAAPHFAYGPWAASWYGLKAVNKMLSGDRKGKVAGMVGEDMLLRGAKIDAWLSRLEQPVSIISRTKAATRIGAPSGIAASQIGSLFTPREQQF